MDGELDNKKRLAETGQYWDQAAAQFDDEPDHGLRDPAVLQAWTALLKAALPGKRGRVLDIGCGTGSLSVVLAGLGYRVTGIDASAEMLALARAKAARLGHTIQFQQMDAAFPQFPRQHFDAILCRHLLWALPDPDQVLLRWAGLLAPAGCLYLIEGYWHTSAGLHAAQVLDALPPAFDSVFVQNLSEQASLWGGPVTDERYAVLACRSTGSDAGISRH